MSLNSYIESLTRVDKTQSVSNVKWTRVNRENGRPKPSTFRGKGMMPPQYEWEKADQRKLKHHREEMPNSYETQQDSQAQYGDHRFAEIIPSVREIGTGYNTFSNQAIERRVKENQAKNAAINESDSSTTYTTANSKSTDQSFNTVADTLSSLKISSDESKTSDSNKGRYKKNALITGLLQSKAAVDNDTSEKSSDLCTSLDIESEEEDWDKEESNDSLYKGRIMRFFQSAEDEDVFCHPLKEQIQKDPEWQKYRLKRKAVEVIQTPRQYYFNLDDDDFNFLPPKESE